MLVAGLELADQLLAACIRRGGTVVNQSIEQRQRLFQGFTSGRTLILVLREGRMHGDTMWAMKEAVLVRSGAHDNLKVPVAKDAGASLRLTGNFSERNKLIYASYGRH